MVNVNTPVEIRVLKGNPGNQPMPEPKTSVTGPPSPPASLKGEAFAQWCRVTAFLTRMGHIENVDYAALVVYCTAWATYDQARHEVETYGVLIAGRDNGQLVKNPAIQVMNDASHTMLSFGAKFGLTPKDRQAMMMVAPDNPDPDGVESLLS